MDNLLIGCAAKYEEDDGIIVFSESADSNSYVWVLLKDGIIKVADVDEVTVDMKHFNQLFRRHHEKIQSRNEILDLSRSDNG